jgi:hypothetical protein
MGPWQAARLYALKSLWSATGLRRAGRTLIDALGSRDEDLRTIAGMLLVQSGKRAEPLIAEAIARREHLPIVLLIAGDIGATTLEPELRRFTADPDRDIARAAHDALRILAATQHKP